MSNYLKQRVLESLKWKKHPKISAQRLGISESEYIRIKDELKTEKKTQKRKSKFF